MLRSLAIFLVGALLGTGFGVALGFFLFPFIFPPPPATEQLTTADRGSTVLAQGTFIHANPSDPIHWGKGSTSVRAKAQIRSSGDLQGQKFVDLGRLRSFKGSQRYAIPAGTDLAQYQSVIIWCERFSVLISPADLMRNS
jgi:hypothetical protein